MPISRRRQGTRQAELVRAVFDLTGALQHRYETVAGAHGLTRQQASILGLLEEPRSMVALADSLGRVASNVTGLIDRMERQGLVIRERDLDDRRVVLIHSTTVGRELYDRFESALYAERLPFEVLSKGEQDDLLVLLRKVMSSDSRIPAGQVVR